MVFGEISDHGSYYFWDGNAYFGYSQDEDQIAIIYTGNMNGKFAAKDDEASMARVMTQITQLRRLYPDSYLIDGGNFTGEENHFGSSMNKSYELKAMEVLAYDGIGLGQKELSLGIDTLGKYFDKAASDEVNTRDYFAYPALLCANLNWDKISNGAIQKSFEKFTPEVSYKVVEKYNSKIGLVGVTDIKNKNLKEASEAAEKAVKKLKKEKDLDAIVLVYNGDDVKGLAQKLDGVDLIISNPSKVDFSQKEEVSEAAVEEINGIYVVETMGIEGVGQIVLEKGKKGLELVSSNSYLVDDSLYENSVMLDLNDEYLKAIDKSYFGLYSFSRNEAIAHNSVGFGKLQKGNSAFGDLISDSYRSIGSKYSDESADLAGAFFASGTVDGKLKKGSVTPDDLYNLFDKDIAKDGLSGANLVDVYVSGAELKILAEIDASISDRNGDVKLYFSGIRYDYNSHRFYRNRVSNVYVGGEKVEPRALYRVITDTKTIQLIEDADKAPFGLMDIQFKDKDGNALSSVDKAVIKCNDHGLKQWAALAKYIDKNGISSRYKNSDDRKVLDDDKSLKAIFANPGKIFLVTFLAGIIAVAVAILIISAILKALGLSRNSFYRRQRRENKQKSIFKHRKNRYNRRMKYRKESKLRAWLQKKFHK